jgi:hypothetical protein
LIVYFVYEFISKVAKKYTQSIFIGLDGAF